MDYSVKGRDILLNQPDFNLDETLDCGQAFRWERVGDGYRGFFLNRPLYITQNGGVFTLHDTTEEEFLTVWYNYFDLSTDYGELKRLFSEDETLSRAVEFAGGIRLLRQDRWEALCSFIISQNNNIPRIKGIIGRLCEKYGGFPSYREIAGSSEEDLAPLRAGFRAKYIIDAANRLASGEIRLDETALLPIEAARAELKRIKGVGDKVAECALLYGMYRTEAFPVDVWIRRVMERYYQNGFPEKFAPYAGIAQQYLFHYIRHLETE